MRDIVHNIKAVAAVPAATRTATFTSDPVDLLGFDSVALVVNTGTVSGSGNMTVKLQESDTTTAGDFIDVPAGLLQGGIAGALVQNGTAKVGYRGFKRYLRAVFTFNSGTSVSTSGTFLLGKAADKPVA
ncbi:hypothetical protein [Antarcticirhabdus aurantiaca]|uniref:Uncharacterized protein n=1 Tax=Antarcticirhabdus aurantiaca TaxID=2606717 RepID=A0ACD4NW04_9HYPH|nr:hypothetical protein OXU80_12450 [Jeongeuplla avenae]